LSNENKGKKPGKKVRKILIAGSLVLLTVVFVFIYANSMLDKIQYDTEDTPNPLQTDAELYEPDPTPENTTSETEVERLNRQLMESLQDESIEIAYDDNVLNILLIGSDTRQREGWCRSDVIILLSVNKDSRKITMTSFMRDLYLCIPDCGYNRINAAYAIGGPDFLMQTIESNFKVSVDKYISVDFFSFIDLVDILGGVDVDIDLEEIDNMNSNIMEVNEYLGVDINDGLITYDGPQHLSGKQALGYARIRYVGNADFDRTARQRHVLNLLIEKGRHMNLFQLNDALNKILPNIITNMSKGEVISLMLDSFDLMKYEVIQNRIPVDGSWEYMYINGMSVLGTDIDQNIQSLKDTIYGD